MKIQICTICDKEFFPETGTSTDYAFDFDPTACPQCNANARKNSQSAIDNKTFIKNENNKKCGKTIFGNSTLGDNGFICSECEYKKREYKNVNEKK